VQELIVPGRFNGPPTSGNGGYTAGLVAGLLPPGPITVTLRRPPPLDSPMTITRPDAETAECHHAGDLVAVGQSASIEVDDPQLGLDELRTMLAEAAPYAGFTDHPFPTCFVCGPERAEGDGLRIFPGACPGGRTIATWRVPADVNPTIVWAALDCPGGWAIIGPGRPYVLGRVTVSVAGLPEPGDECLIAGESIGAEGRKGHVRSALYSPTGVLLAHAQATWISL
jgi:hypothetical protein